MASPRPTTPRLLQQLMVVVVLVALGVVPTRGTAAAAAQDKPAPSPAAAKAFLHACCAATRNASICYGSLLPYADSFHGSHVKVSRAAAAGVYSQLRGFRRIRREVHYQGLLPCALDVVAGMVGQRKSLAALRRLEKTAAAGPGMEQQARRDLSDAKDYISFAGSRAAQCAREFANGGCDANSGCDANVVKDVADWVERVELHVGIALDLLNSIAL